MSHVECLICIIWLAKPNEVRYYAKNFYKEIQLSVSLTRKGHNFYKLKYISLEEVKIVPFQQ